MCMGYEKIDAGFGWDRVLEEDCLYGVYIAMVWDVMVKASSAFEWVCDGRCCQSRAWYKKRSPKGAMSVHSVYILG